MELSKKNTIKDFIKSLPLYYYIVSFKQGSSRLVALFNRSCGVCSIWHEFYLNPYSRFEGLSWREKESPNSIKEFEESFKDTEEYKKEFIKARYSSTM